MTLDRHLAARSLQGLVLASAAISASAPAAAGDIDIKFDTVLQFDWGMTPFQHPALAGIMQGDVLSFQFSVFYGGQPGVEPGLYHALDPANTFVELPNGTRIYMDPVQPAPTVFGLHQSLLVYDGPTNDLDWFEMDAPILGGAARLTGLFIDESGNWLTSGDLQTLVATGQIDPSTMPDPHRRLGQIAEDGGNLGWMWGNVSGFQVVPGDPLGTSYCGPAALNSAGQSATINALGTQSVALNDVQLVTQGLPNNVFGLFITSQEQAFVTNPGGSQGNLCLGGAIGRYNAAGQIQNSGTNGSFSFILDLTQTPTPTGPVSVAPGETWNYQAWYRDSVQGQSTSNFTDGYSISYQ